MLCWFRDRWYGIYMLCAAKHEWFIFFFQWCGSEYQAALTFGGIDGIICLWWIRSGQTCLLCSEIFKNRIHFSFLMLNMKMQKLSLSFKCTLLTLMNYPFVSLVAVLMSIKMCYADGQPPSLYKSLWSIKLISLFLQLSELLLPAHENQWATDKPDTLLLKVPPVAYKSWICPTTLLHPALPHAHSSLETSDNQTSRQHFSESQPRKRLIWWAAYCLCLCVLACLCMMCSEAIFNVCTHMHMYNV